MDSPASISSPHAYKRKQHMEEVILLKKLKLNETKSGTHLLFISSVKWFLVSTYFDVIF